MGVLAVEKLKLGKGGTRRLNKKLPTSGTPVTGVLATGTLSLATQPTADDDSITIGTTVYTFVAAGTAAAAGEVNLGADIAATRPLLVAAINGDALNAAHPDAIASDFATADMVVTAKVSGTDGNAIATTTDLTDVTDDFGAATLAGGVTGVGDDADVGDQLIDDTNLYFCVVKKVPAGAAVETPAVYKKIALASL